LGSISPFALRSIFFSISTNTFKTKAAQSRATGRHCNYTLAGGFSVLTFFMSPHWSLDFLKMCATCSKRLQYFTSYDPADFIDLPLESVAVLQYCIFALKD
jgi:hypothetical protein